MVATAGAGRSMSGALAQPDTGEEIAGHRARGLWLQAAFVLLLLAYWLAWLGAAPLFDVDEGAFSEASREMLASGDWLHTTLNGADRFDKPILVYWFQAAALHAFGATEFAARLPSALFAWLWCVATAAFVAPRWGRAAAAVAGAILCTSIGPMLIGRGATADALLNLLLALAMFDLVRFVESEARDLTMLRRAAAWTGLGILAKGPIALLVPAGSLFVLLLWRRRAAWPAVRRIVTDPGAWAIALAIALPWYVYALHRHGRAFIEGFFMRHNVERFTGTLEHHGGSLYYYVLVLPLLMLPWTPWLVALLRRLWAERREMRTDVPAALLACWFAFVLVFFSFSGTKLPHYLLYGYTPMVVALACLLASGARHRVAAVATCLLCAGFVLLGLASPEVASALGARQSNPIWREITNPATLPAMPSRAWGALAVAVAALAAAWAFVQPKRTAAACCIAAFGMAVWFNAQLVPWWGETLQGPVRTLAREARAQGWPLVQQEVRQPSAGFYREAPAPSRPPQGGEAVLTRADRAGSFGGKVVRSERGFALVYLPR